MLKIAWKLIKATLRQTSRSAFLKKASVLIIARYLRCLTLKIISVCMSTRNHFTSGKRLLIPCSIVFFFQNQKPKPNLNLQSKPKKEDRFPPLTDFVLFSLSLIVSFYTFEKISSQDITRRYILWFNLIMKSKFSNCHILITFFAIGNGWLRWLKSTVV